MRTVQYLGYPELRTYIGRRLFTCWLDFALKLDRIKEAQPPPAVADLDTLPENVLDTSASTSASAKSTSAAGGGSASASSASASTTTATSAAETRSSAQPTQAIESAPIPTSQPPGMPETHQPLNIPPVVPDWLANINSDLRERRVASPIPTTLLAPRRIPIRHGTSTTAVTAETSASSSSVPATSASTVPKTPPRPPSTASTVSLQQSPTRGQKKSGAHGKTPSPTKSTGAKTPATAAREGPLTRSRSPAKPAKPTSFAPEPDE